MIEVEVVYALKEKQYIKRVILEYGATVKQAIFASTILELCTNIDLNKNKVGIFGRLVKLSSIVKNGDRIEIYRPLIMNPRMLFLQRKKKTRQSHQTTN